MNNSITIKMESNSINEAFARAAVSAFISPLDPTLEELADVRTAVSEAVTNAVIHGYAMGAGVITMKLNIASRSLTVEIIDFGKGIEDVKKAMQPFYTTGPDGERSGMGFAVMQAFMDTVRVCSEPGKGTSVLMTKTIPGAEK